MSRCEKKDLFWDVRDNGAASKHWGAWRPRFNCFWRSTCGASTLAMAVAVPVLLFVLAGIIQFGALVYVGNQMTNVARETARRVAMGELNEVESEAFARDSLVDWGINYSVNTTLVANSSDNTKNDIIVDISAPVSQVAIVDVIGAFQGQVLSTHAMMLSH